MLKPCPPAGDGAHHWILYAAKQLLDFRVPQDDAESLIAEMLTREPQSREIENTFRKILATGSNGAANTKKPRWPARDTAQIEKLASAGPGVLELWQSSPSPIPFGKRRTEEYIDVLFPADSLLCVGKSKRSFQTRPRQFWRGRLADCAFIVPSPMTAIQGRTQDGRMSEHTLDNTGPRRFLIIEADTGPLDQQAAILAHLATIAPLALVEFTNSKSLHGWFYCAGQPDTKVEAFMRLAYSLNADKATWSRFQFVRMPDGRREAIKEDRLLLPDAFPAIPADFQPVIYFNPEVVR